MSESPNELTLDPNELTSDPNIRKFQPRIPWPDTNYQILHDCYTAYQNLRNRYDFRNKVCLGQGGQGIVWQIKDLEIDRTVAIKASNKPNMSARFLREVQIQAKFKHPSVMPVYEIYSKSDPVCFTMPYIDGVSLFDFLKSWHGFQPQRTSPPLTKEEKEVRERRERCLKKLKNNMTLSKLLGIFENLCRLVAYIHQHNYAHRDLNPKNLLIDADGKIYLIDFGCARKLVESQPLASRGNGPGDSPPPGSCWPDGNARQSLDGNCSQPADGNTGQSIDGNARQPSDPNATREMPADGADPRQQDRRKIPGTKGYTDSRLIAAVARSDQLPPADLKRADIYSLGMILAEILCNRNDENGRWSPYNAPQASFNQGMDEFLKAVETCPVRLPQVGEIGAGKDDKNPVADRRALITICADCLGVDKNGYPIDHGDSASAFDADAEKIADEIRALLEYRNGQLFRLPYSKRLLWYCAEHLGRIALGLAVLVVIGAMLWLPLWWVDQAIGTLQGSQDITAIERTRHDISILPGFYRSLRQGTLNRIDGEIAAYHQFTGLLASNELKQAALVRDKLQLLASLNQFCRRKLQPLVARRRQDEHAYRQCLAAHPWIERGDISAVPYCDWPRLFAGNGYFQPLIAIIANYRAQAAADAARYAQIYYKRLVDWQADCHLVPREFERIYSQIFPRHLPTEDYFPNREIYQFMPALRSPRPAAIYLLHRLSHPPQQIDRARRGGFYLLVIELLLRLSLPMKLSQTATTAIKKILFAPADKTKAQQHWCFIGYWLLASSPKLDNQAKWQNFLNRALAGISKNNRQLWLIEHWLPLWCQKIAGQVTAQRQPQALLKQLLEIHGESRYSTLYRCTVQYLLFEMSYALAKKKQLRALPSGLLTRLFKLNVAEYHWRSREFLSNPQYRQLLLQAYDTQQISTTHGYYRSLLRLAKQIDVQAQSSK